MKAAIFTELHNPLRVEDVADPTPDRYSVLLKVCRCGICGSDLHMTEDPIFGIKRGDILGHEFSGEILEVGSGVQGLKVGDFVTAAPLYGCGECATCLRGDPAWCANMKLQGGGYAQYAAVTERQCRKLSWGISPSDGALVEPLSVALHGLMRSGMKPGQRVAVVGAGAIGLAVAFWARRLGAAQVAVLDLHDFQEERAMNLGASSFLSGTEDVSARLNSQLGAAPDIVFECVGSPGLIDHCIDLVRPHGTVVVLGLCTKQDHLNSFRAICKEVTVVMSVFFDMHEFNTAISALDSGAYSPQALISETVSLTALPTSFEALKKRTTQCKVLVNPFEEASA